MPRGGVLHDPNQLVEVVCDLCCAVLGQQRVEAPELDERGGDETVLRLDGPPEQELCDRSRKARRDIEAGRVGRRIRTPRLECGPAKQQRLALGGSDVARIEERRGLGAQRDFAGVGDRLHVHRARRARAGNKELSMEVADEEELEHAGVEAERHPQRDLTRRA